MKVFCKIFADRLSSESKCSFNILKDFDKWLSCGAYSVSGLYEGKVKTTTAATFCVVLDYERSVPELITLIGGADIGSRCWARDELFSVLGKPIWKPLGNIREPDTQERIDLEVAALRKCWEEHKDLVLLVEARSREAEKLRRSVSETEHAGVAPNINKEVNQKSTETPDSNK